MSESSPGTLYAPAMPAGARHITFVVGARPNFMKAAPVHRALQEAGAEVTLVHTGQHYDAEMSEVFLSQLGLPKPDVFLGVGSGTHGQQTAKALVGHRGGAARAAPRHGRRRRAT